MPRASMSPSDALGRVLVVIPEYRAPELTDAVMDDLFRDAGGSGEDPGLGSAASDVRLVVVDNGGEYRSDRAGVEVYRPGGNLRWIGATNWALEVATADDDAVVVVLNNDIRLSRGFLAGLLQPFTEHDDLLAVAACYDDFWLHQRARPVPASAEAYEPSPVLRTVPFCDGTAVAFSVAAIRRVGLLDTATFPRHGYGSDLDLALRGRELGLRCTVTERAYVSHLRRQTMIKIGQSAESNRAEILDGMNAKWGDAWRAPLGLGPGAFPPHNTGSGADWYLNPPTGG